MIFVVHLITLRVPFFLFLIFSGTLLLVWPLYSLLTLSSSTGLSLPKPSPCLQASSVAPGFPGQLPIGLLPIALLTDNSNPRKSSLPLKLDTPLWVPIVPGL